MKIPRKIDICGEEYHVTYEDTPDMDGEVVEGYIDLDTKVIVLERGMRAEKTCLIFVHECLHGVLWECGLTRGWSKSMVQWVEEPVVDALSKWICRTLLR